MQTLPKRIFTSIILALIVGIIISYTKNIMPEYMLSFITEGSENIGNIFLRLLKMLIIPMIFSMIYVSIKANRDTISGIAKNAVFWYVTTTFIAVFLGIVLVNIFQPGHFTDTAVIEKMQIDVPQNGINYNNVFLKIISEMVPDNIFNAFANGTIVQVIFFTIFISIIANKFNIKTDVLDKIVIDIKTLIQTCLEFVVKISPYFLFFLVLHKIIILDLKIFYVLLSYCFIVVFGIFIHCAFVISLIVYKKTGMSPIQFVKSIMPAILTAWSTASSSASIPVSLSCLSKMRADKKISEFVLPLGITINMNGTALYEGASVVFITQLFGMDLSIYQQIILFATSIIASIGTAGIPGAAIVTMGICLNAVCVPSDGIGIIMVVERLLDQIRTVANVYADIAIAYILGHKNNIKKNT